MNDKPTREMRTRFRVIPRRVGRVTPSAAILGLANFVALALLVSHVFSYGWNFLDKGEYRRASLQALMREPYGRVVVLHLVGLLGGFAVLALGQPVGALMLLIALKMGIHVAAHLHEQG